MPKCRYCGARLTKFDNDICPVCGTKNPLEGVQSETIEITSQVDLSGFADGQKVKRHRQTMLLLFLLVGFSGAPFFYLKQKKTALIWLGAHLLAIGGLFALFFFALHLHLALAIILPILTSYVINALAGVMFYKVPNLKDGEGEFVV